MTNQTYGASSSEYTTEIDVDAPDDDDLIFHKTVLTSPSTTNQSGTVSYVVANAIDYANTWWGRLMRQLTKPEQL
jgi:hypothetical protein